MIIIFFFNWNYHRLPGGYFANAVFNRHMPTYNYTQRSNINPTTRYYRVRPVSKDCVYNTNAVYYNGSLS